MTDRRGFLRSVLALLAAPVSTLLPKAAASPHISGMFSGATFAVGTPEVEWIDEALAEMWDSNLIRPDRIWVSAETFARFHEVGGVRMIEAVGPFRFVGPVIEDREARRLVAKWTTAPGRPLAKLVEAERRLA